LTEPNRQITRARNSSLDIDDADLRALAKAFADLSTEYFTGVAQRRVFTTATGAELQTRFDEPPPRDHATLESSLTSAARSSTAVVITAIRGSLVTWLRRRRRLEPFADLVASSLNASVTSWRSSPAATQIEQTVVRWLGALIGYDEDAHGLLTSGGSLANLTALLIAHRSRSLASISETGIQNSGPRLTIYASDLYNFIDNQGSDISRPGSTRAAGRLHPC
jgi:hypothetical protein